MQIGDALVVLGKQLARKRVTTPRKKKGRTISSGPIAAPRPPYSLVSPLPSAPTNSIPPPCQMAPSMGKEKGHVAPDSTAVRSTPASPIATSPTAASLTAAQRSGRW